LISQEQLRTVKNTQAVAIASIDQLDSWLGEHIEEVVDLVEGNTADELVDKYGLVVSTLIVYAYSVLITNTTNDIVKKLDINRQII
jgi:hypothetical protein